MCIFASNFNERRRKHGGALVKLIGRGVAKFVSLPPEKYEKICLAGWRKFVYEFSCKVCAAYGSAKFSFVKGVLFPSCFPSGIMRKSWDSGEIRMVIILVLRV